MSANIRKVTVFYEADPAARLEKHLRAESKYFTPAILAALFKLDKIVLIDCDCLIADEGPDENEEYANFADLNFDGPMQVFGIPIGLHSIKQPNSVTFTPGPSNAYQPHHQMGGQPTGMTNPAMGQSSGGWQQQTGMPMTNAAPGGGQMQMTTMQQQSSSGGPFVNGPPMSSGGMAQPGPMTGHPQQAMRSMAGGGMNPQQSPQQPQMMMGGDNRTPMAGMSPSAQPQLQMILQRLRNAQTKDEREIIFHDLKKTPHLFAAFLKMKSSADMHNQGQQQQQQQPQQQGGQQQQQVAMQPQQQQMMRQQHPQQGGAQ